MPNGLHKYMRFSLDNNLVMIDGFQFLSSSLDSLVKNLCESDCMHLSQEFDSEVLDLVRQKGFYSYKYMCDFGSFDHSHKKWKDCLKTRAEPTVFSL